MQYHLNINIMSTPLADLLVCQSTLLAMALIVDTPLARCNKSSSLLNPTHTLSLSSLLFCYPICTSTIVVSLVSLFQSSQSSQSTQSTHRFEQPPQNSSFSYLFTINSINFFISFFAFPFFIAIQKSGLSSIFL